MPRRNRRRKQKRKPGPPEPQARKARYMGWFRDFHRPRPWKACEKSAAYERDDAVREMERKYGGDPWEWVVLKLPQTPTHDPRWKQT